MAAARPGPEKQPPREPRRRPPPPPPPPLQQLHNHNHNNNHNHNKDKHKDIKKRQSQKIRSTSLQSKPCKELPCTHGLPLLCTINGRGVIVSPSELFEAVLFLSEGGSQLCASIKFLVETTTIISMTTYPGATTTTTSIAVPAKTQQQS